MKSLRIIVLALCLLLCACSAPNAGSAENTGEETTGEEILYELKTESWIIFEKTLEECIADPLSAEYIIKGTVTEVGDAVLSDGYELYPEMPEEQMAENVSKIYTPVTFVPEVIYRASDGVVTEQTPEDQIPEVGRALSLREWYGTYQGFRHAPHTSRILLEEGCEYVLFLYTNVDGKLSIWQQPSIVLRADGTFASLMNNAKLYAAFESIDEVLAYYEALE